MKSHRILQFVYPALMAAGLHGNALGQVVISFTAMTDYSTGPGNPTYLLFPDVNAGGIPGISNLVLDSPTGSFQMRSGFTNPSDNFSSSLNYTDYGLYLNEIGFAGSEMDWVDAGTPALPQWTLTFNQGLPEQRVFNFGLTANDLNPDPAPAFEVTTPGPGASVTPNLTLQWEALPGTENTFLGVNPVPFGPPGNQTDSLPGTATSWTVPQALRLGANRFYINQSRSLVSHPSVIGFSEVGGTGELLPGVSLFTFQSSFVSRDFNVVPEPHEWIGLTSLGLAGLALWRRLPTRAH